jgi:Calcineurin-like phosphoesterase
LTRTLIVSDLHLGGLSGVDLLRRPAPRDALLRALTDVDRLILLGDTLELRHGPPHEALAAARPFFEDLGAALGGDRELVLVAGNHDHMAIGAWLEERSLGEPEPAPLGLEQRIDPAVASPLLRRIAQWTSPARVSVAYPGLWVRPDVYAIHGHYLDAHLTIPTLERIGVGMMGRLLERRPAGADFGTVEDYEAVTTPIYSWRAAMTRYGRSGPALNGVATVRAWRALGGGGGISVNGARPRARLQDSLRRRALVTAFPLIVSALNRAGLGPLDPNITGVELRRAGLRAMGEVAARLGLGDAYVIFGHTHRAGPLPGDSHVEWRGRGGARLINAGSWIYEPTFLTQTPGESPYWPGVCVLVEDSGPPVLKRLLSGRSHAELMAPLPE